MCNTKQLYVKAKVVIVICRVELFEISMEMTTQKFCDKTDNFFISTRASWCGIWLFSKYSDRLRTIVLATEYLQVKQINDVFHFVAFILSFIHFPLLNGWKYFSLNDFDYSKVCTLQYFLFSHNPPISLFHFKNSIRFDFHLNNVLCNVGNVLLIRL